MSIWEKILFKGTSSFSGEIKVTEHLGTRRLVANGFTQSQSLKPNGQTGLAYWDEMIPKDLSLAEDARVLILGLGGGTTAKIITKRFGPVAIDGVEIDPLMISLGQKYFAMNEPNLNIITADAKKFVKEARYKYDLICVDIFLGNSVPKEIETHGFLENVALLLKEGSVVTINKIFSGKEELETFEKFVRRVFPLVHSFVVRGNVKMDNVIIYAQK